MRMNVNLLFREIENQLFADEVVTTPASTHLPARWWALYLECLFVATMLLYFLLPVQPSPWLLTPLSILASLALFIPLVKLLKRLPSQWLNRSIRVACGLLILELFLPLLLAVTLLLTHL